MSSTVNVRNYSLSETVVASVRLSDQVALIVLLLAVFSSLSHAGPMSPTTASILVVTVSFCLYLTFLFVSDKGEGTSFKNVAADR